MDVKKVAVVFVSAVMAFGSLTLADTILIDFGLAADRHSVGAADSNGNYWDYITGATDNNLDLINTDNAATTIDLQMSGFDGGGPNTFNSALTPNAGLNGGLFAFNDVTDDAIFFVSGDSPTITLSQLNSGFTYNFTFYGSRVTSDDRYTTFAIGSETVTNQTSGSAIGSDGNDWNDDTVVSIIGVSPNGSNQIIINLESSTGASGSDFGYINAMQIDIVPEPASLSLILLGGLILHRIRRRR